MFRSVVLLSATALFILFINVTDASAITQWSRKYKVQCSLCHTVVPRINYYGERFMRNGYQMPDTQDGDETGKIHSGNVVVDDHPVSYRARI